jgi:glucose-fructose oxidoreductase
MAKRSRKVRGEPVRFAVIGQGYFAQAAVLPAFAAARGCRLVTVFSEDEQKLRALKRKYGLEAALSYDQYDEYLASHEVDAVYIALPNDLHREYVVRAARAGVHVLCEKPIGVDAHEAEDMIAACEHAGVKLMVAYRLHFESATLDAIERVQRGEIGAPRYFTSSFAMQVKPGNIRTQQERGGGPLLDVGIYCVNAARALFRAEPTEVMAMSARRARDTRFREIDEQVSVLLKFPDDRLAQFTCSFGAYDHSTLAVVGDKGRLQLEPAYEWAGALSMQVETTGGKPRRKTFPKVDQVAAELDAFAACIRDGSEPEASGEEGLADMRVLDAIQSSLESGHSEPVAGVERRARPSRAQATKRQPHGKANLVNVQPPHR